MATWSRRTRTHRVDPSGRSGFFIAVGVILGETEGLFRFVTFSVLFWLQFYFIWIGVHWIRWLAGAWCGVIGLMLFVEGLRDGNGFFIALACLNFVIGTYLALSPSVYFFAKRQQERRSWPHSIAVAAVFILLFLSFFLGTASLSAYRAQLENEAREFADEAFTRIFSQHDTYYFLDHVALDVLEKAGGRDRATKFLQSTTLYAGDVHDIQKPTGRLRLIYPFPQHVRLHCHYEERGLGRTRLDSALSYHLGLQQRLADSKHLVAIPINQRRICVLSDSQRESRLLIFPFDLPAKTDLPKRPVFQLTTPPCGP